MYSDTARRNEPCPMKIMRSRHSSPYLADFRVHDLRHTVGPRTSSVLSAT